MEDLGQLVKLRREKLDEFRGMGISPYINRYHVNTTTASLFEKYSGMSKEELDEKNSEYITAGRMQYQFCCILAGEPPVAGSKNSPNGQYLLLAR